MNRIIALLFIALLTFAIVMLAFNPDVFQKIYLYLIGLFGFIVKAFQSFFESIKETLNLNRVENPNIEEEQNGDRKSENTNSGTASESKESLFEINGAVG